MLGSAREIARTLFSFAETRTRLAATEIEEQAVRVVEILVWLAVALFFLSLALLFLGIMIVLLFWDSNRLLAAGLLTALFLGAGAAAALVARSLNRERPKFLAATLAELKLDRDRMRRP